MIYLLFMRNINNTFLLIYNYIYIVCILISNYHVVIFYVQSSSAFIEPAISCNLMTNTVV